MLFYSSTEQCSKKPFVTAFLRATAHVAAKSQVTSKRFTNGADRTTKQQHLIRLKSSLTPCSTAFYKTHACFASPSLSHHAVSSPSWFSLLTLFSTHDIYYIYDWLNEAEKKIRHRYRLSIQNKIAQYLRDHTA